MSSQAVPHVTVNQYLEIERKAEFRSEYVNGEMYAMAGGTLNHARIVRNALARLEESLRGGPCEAVASDMRLFCANYSIFTYPDIVIPCGQLRFLDDRRDTISDATAIIEVLSPSTANDDRGEKFRYYRSLASFSEYLLLAQDSVRAEHHRRQSDGSWLFREFTSPDTELELSSVNCLLKLSAVYDRVDFAN